MKSPFVRRCAALASALAAASGALLAGATPAHAILTTDKVAVAAGGSDTSEKMMNTIMSDLNGTSVTITGDGTPTARTTVNSNIPAFSTAPFGPVQGDSTCNVDQTWSKDPLAPGSNSAATLGIEPFGSSAGRNYLAAEETGNAAQVGCIDVARSSGAPRAATKGDKSTFEYYAYAIDSLTWATTSLKAPGALTVQNLDDIYDCVVTNWNQLPGGSTGPIQRYIPQVGSGTRSFFISDVLRKASSYSPPTGVSGCPDSIIAEENRGDVVSDANLDKAILPYSAAVWSLHVNNKLNPSLNLSKGARLGGLINAGINDMSTKWNPIDRAYQLNTDTVVTEANIGQATGVALPPFPGVRYIYNVIDSAGNKPGYQAASVMLGFTNTSGSNLTNRPLCNGSEISPILDNGFAPLDTSNGGAAANGSNVAGSNCRFFQGVN